MAMTGKTLPNRCDFLLRCADFSAALDHYTGQLGFRLDLIYPADNPRVAELSGYGITVRLESETAVAPPDPSRTSDVIIQVANDESWGAGRAGMQYRDLLPGRLGGRFIASHIRIRKGGPVADYVHHHQVRFQMIYCYRGWVRVVYEDQGEPFVMQAGDCVLQPPHIRHRVLESSDGMEVVEIGSPAEHETRVDHELRLPNENVNPDRVFDGQKFIFHQAARASWRPGPAEGFEMRDTGIADATGGVASALVLRPSETDVIASSTHQEGLFFNFVLRGTLHLAVSTLKSRTLKPGDCFQLPAHTAFILSNLSSDLELLRVTSA